MQVHVAWASVSFALAVVLCSSACECLTAPMLAGFDVSQIAGSPILLDDINGWVHVSGRAVSLCTVSMLWQRNNTAEQQELLRAWNSGAVPILSWLPSAWTNLCSFTPNKAILDSHFYDSYIDDTAAFILDFVSGPDSALGTSDDRRLFLRFAPDPNSGLYPWSPKCSYDREKCYGPIDQSTDSYVELWNFVLGKVRAQIPSRQHLQVIWNIYFEDPDNTPITNFLPKSDLFDWVALTAFNWGSLKQQSWNTPSAVLNPGLSALRQAAPGLPCMVFVATTDAYYGRNVVEQKKYWIQELFRYASTSSSISAIVYRDDNDLLRSSKTERTRFAAFWNMAARPPLAVDGDDSYMGGHANYSAISTLRDALRDTVLIALSNLADPHLISDSAFAGSAPKLDSSKPFPYVAVGGLCAVVAFVTLSLLLFWKTRPKKTAADSPMTEGPLLDSVSTAAFRGVFEPLRILSHTSRSTVFEVAHRATGIHYAIKQTFIYDDLQYTRAQNEVDKMDLCGGIPGVLHLKQSSMFYPMSRAALTETVTESHMCVVSLNAELEAKEAAKSQELPRANSNVARIHSSEKLKDQNSTLSTSLPKTVASPSVSGGERRPLLNETSSKQLVGASTAQSQSNVRIMTVQTQLYPQGNLTHYVDDKHILIPWLTVGTWVLSLAATLKRMHSLRCGTIVHCDVCTDNVLLNGEEVVLGGLSSAILQNEDLSSPVFAADVEAPTTAWTAPEIAEGRMGVPATDVWGLGCVMFAMMTRETHPEVPLRTRAANAETFRTEVAERLAAASPPADYPAQPMELMYRCLAFNPDSRPQVEQVIEDLQLNLQPARSRKK